MADTTVSQPAPVPDLPTDFLKGLRPDMKADRIDFGTTVLSEYQHLYAVIIDNVLTPKECRALLRAAEATAPNTGWERAMVNVGGGRQKMYEDVRKCGRIICDSQDLASRVWDRVKDVPDVSEMLRLDHRPKITGTGPSQRNEVWVLTRPNERMRFLKYVGGEYFKGHCDGTYETPDRKERSYMTMHLYLNDTGLPPPEVLESMSSEERLEVGPAGLVGGETAFHSMHYPGRKLDVEPKAGRVLIFQHRGLLHSGEDVVQGVKYTMRTDMMYALEKDVDSIINN
ncbi:hypothetical protein B0A48_12448 [Cryoendolithus antarcticus]|uniref:Prolyl 4-hydroxylase alpha subunit domain-containing protein n=1 Tax=Cryoendolithus antarcticus TaxID=1507870 RepID=A0A1V8SS10_9PEZI|nr:hypothetical protein B0A48_12448 [Cryoendolithus antarcticus]